MFRLATKNATGLAVISSTLLASAFTHHGSLALLPIVFAPAFLLDLGDEVRVRWLGFDRSVWPLHNPLMRFDLLTRLDDVGIEGRVRGHRLHELFGLLCSFAPTEILVSPADAERASEVLLAEMSARSGPLCSEYRPSKVSFHWGHLRELAPTDRRMREGGARESGGGNGMGPK